MHIILRYQTGHRVDAILLSANAERMRLVVKEHTDTVELNRIREEWFADCGSAVEIESILADDAAIVARVCGDSRPRVSTVAC